MNNSSDKFNHSFCLWNICKNKISLDMIFSSIYFSAPREFWVRTW